MLNSQLSNKIFFYK